MMSTAVLEDYPRHYVGSTRIGYISHSDKENSLDINDTISQITHYNIG